MLNSLEENICVIDNDSLIPDFAIDRTNVLDDYDRSNFDPDNDEFSYQSPLPKRSFTVKARIRFGGRTQPLTYSVDE